ncbi:glycosyltransferase family 2 protein [Aegicerativicinus sediminis]|uniref:glycosyltransferase family 2 protein n=1 Tax=Aegicerativicinus sediminis TaxID=2893202 RepID=UPI001E42FD38|nr:glycosyltransferase family 2 protein [Aegicerativicinus sediminis]
MNTYLMKGKGTKLSIITINFNNINGLKKTIQSVLKQSFHNYEYIIIDGGSNDGSAQLIEEYAAELSYWISEPDNGIYDAMNKGIKKAIGEYCLFLNSGDYLLGSTTLEKIFQKPHKEDILYGDLKSDFRDYLYPETITLNTFVKATIPHQASFIKKSLFNTYGFYDESYPIIADWVFFLKAVFKYNATTKHVGQFVSFFEHGGISTSRELHEQLMQQRSCLLLELFPNIYPDYISLHNQLLEQEKELNSYRNSRLIQMLRKFQKQILKSR